jgi:hypothetical protein
MTEVKTVDADKPDTHPVEIPESYTEARLRALEEKFNTERFKDDTYYPNLIKSEREIGEIIGRLDEISKNALTTARKADNAVTVVNDHDGRLGTQFAAYDNRIESMNRKMVEMGSQFDEIIRFIRNMQEAEKDRKVIVERGRWAFNLFGRIALVMAAGGGINIVIEILKIILGGK